MAFERELSRIQEKLERVRAQGLHCFGSDKHGFRLKSPLSERAVQAFEKKYDFRLPDDYREFITTLGASGAGPYLGILPLDQWDAATQSGQKTLPTDYLRKPSPLIPGEKPVLATKDDEDAEPGDELVQGSIALFEQGCSYYALLIVAGPSRGRVAYVSLDDWETVYFPENPNFISLYERWLDELLLGYEGSWFGFGASGTEAELAERLGDATRIPEYKIEAVRTLERISKPSDTTLEAAWRCAQDAPESLREKVAIFLVDRLPSGHKHISFFLEDSSADVRKSALLSLARSKKKELTDAIRHFLSDPSSDVVSAALLHGENQLSAEEVLPLLNRADPSIRRLAVYAMGRVKEPDQDALLTSVLHDSDLMTRVYAVQALSQLRVSSASMPLAGLLKTDVDYLLRTNIVKMLGGLKSREAVPILIECLQDPDAFIRYDAINALVEIGDSRAIPALKALTSDNTMPVKKNKDGSGMSTSESVGSRARWALKQI